eukprot:3804597-Prymnesium_polylepis.2
MRAVRHPRPPPGGRRLGRRASPSRAWRRRRPAPCARRRRCPACSRTLRRPHRRLSPCRTRPVP